MKTVLPILVAIIVSHVSNAYSAEPDVDAGKKVFKKCASCHSLEPAKNKIGPTLYGILDNASAQVEKYKYSKAMKTSGIIWNEENLALFLKKPKKLVKKTTMAFVGLKKPEQIVNLIAYLKTTEPAE